jgi:hypothetical protein
MRSKRYHVSVYKYWIAGADATLVNTVGMDLSKEEAERIARDLNAALHLMEAKGAYAQVMPDYFDGESDRDDSDLQEAARDAAELALESRKRRK